MTVGKIAILFALAGAQTILAQTWTITKVVDNTTACPGSSQGYFNAVGTFPAINGPWVVFVDYGDDHCTANNGPSIWSYNLITKALVKLVDTSTPIPEGTGDFAGLGPGGNSLQVNNGTVLFYGYGSGVNPVTACEAYGLYTVSVAGGTIFRVVDDTTPLPGFMGSVFCHLNNDYGGLSLNRGRVLFSANAATSAYANDGVWRAPANVNTIESDFDRIADMSTVYTSPFPSGVSNDQWFGGSIGAAALAFTGGGEVGVAGLFVDSYSNPILLSSYVLPGDAAHDTTYPYNASFYIGPIVDSADIFFVATDPFYQGTCANGGGTGTGTFTGVFRTGLTGGAATSILNTCDTQPNRDSIGANSFTQLAANEGTAVFPVLDNTTGNYVLDSSVNGAISPILAPGDPLPSSASCSGVAGTTGCATVVSPAGTGGISGGRVAFNAESGPNDEGIWVASLPCAGAVTSEVSITLGSLTYSSTTKLWSQTATVANPGTTGIAGPLSLVLKDLTSQVTLTNRNGTTVCFSPEGSPYIDLYLSSNDKLPAGTSTKVTLEFSDPSDAGITFTSKVAGAGAR